MTAVEIVVENLKKMSKQVSTPEEIAQVRSRYSYLYNPVKPLILKEFRITRGFALENANLLSELVKS